MTVTIKSRALVLQSIRWSESSKIIHLFCEEKGLLKVIARGALRPGSPFQGVLENLNHVEAIITVKESRGLQILSQADLILPFTHIRDNLESTAVAFSIMELLRALVRENEASHPLFRYTIETLREMNQKEMDHHLLFLLIFILFISEYLGFGWEFDQCRVCKKPAGTFAPRLDPVRGAVVCPACSSGITGKIHPLSRSQHHLLFQLQKSSPAGLKSIRTRIPADLNYQPLLDILLSHLNYHTEQNLELKSLKMYTL